MIEYTIRLERSNNVRGIQAASSLGTDSVNGMLSIAGVEQPEILRETDEFVDLTYRWSGASKFWETDEYLAKFGVRRVWPDPVR
ncbi:hypothetical protein [Aquipseudomonas guryensis]|jgi:hypothetical protein|uniref:Uncharacterized protein n=1 Tax=Aquipseudomonas guryensis TaxID=2759165 RepID=A0A7W4H402_9GAMM|nr:hypothetical protein [Pseudomonas guryensis]MBB1520060.1 hypothetical protein [Pseudomonas guryensis]